MSLCPLLANLRREDTLTMIGLQHRVLSPSLLGLRPSRAIPVCLVSCLLVVVNRVVVGFTPSLAPVLQGLAIMVTLLLVVAVALRPGLAILMATLLLVVAAALRPGLANLMVTLLLVVAAALLRDLLKITYQDLGDFVNDLEVDRHIIKRNRVRKIWGMHEFIAYCDSLYLMSVYLL